MKARVPDCRVMERLLSDYTDGLLGPEERARVEVHLAGCPTCVALLADYRAIAARLRRGPQVTPPPSVRRAVLAGIRPRRYRSPSTGYDLIGGLRALADRLRGGPSLPRVPEPAPVAAGGDANRWLSTSYKLLANGAIAVVLMLWVGLVLWLFQGIDASRLLVTATAPRAPAAASPVTFGSGVPGAAGGNEPDGYEGAASAAVLVWAHANEVWAAAPGGTPQKIGDVPGPEGSVADFTISRDEKRIAYVVHGKDGATLRVASAGSDDAQPLLTTGYATGLTWSPDSRYLYIFAGDGADDLTLMKVDASDGSRSLLPLKAPFAFWSRDSRYLAHTVPLSKPGWQRIQIVAAATGDPAGAAEAALPEGYLAWSPDGSALLFAAYTWRAGDNDRPTGPARVFSLRPGENALTPLQGNSTLLGEADYLRPQLSPDGRSVAFLYHPRQPGERVPPLDPRTLHTDLAVMGADGKGARSLVGVADGERISGVQWSPDSRYLAYLVTPTEARPGATQPGQVWIVPAKGGSPRPLSPRYDDGALLTRVQWVAGAAGKQ